LEDIPDILPYSLFLIPYYLFLYIIIIFSYIPSYSSLCPGYSVTCSIKDRSLQTYYVRSYDEVPNESAPSEYRGKGLEYQVERSTLVQSTLLPAAQQ
jgi:hypothetical protein